MPGSHSAGWDEDLSHQFPGEPFPAHGLANIRGRVLGREPAICGRLTGIIGQVWQFPSL